MIVYSALKDIIDRLDSHSDDDEQVTDVLILQAVVEELKKTSPDFLNKKVDDLLG
jgi:hypothetical protein